MKNLQDFPRICLAALPTPIQKLENISRLLGTNIYIKRDDLTGIGLGGNKVRKLEFLLADAKRKGAEIVFTTGGAQSNHAMLTAACAKKLGMTPILILKKRGVTERKGNQLLEYLMDTDVRFVDTDDYNDIYAAWAKSSADPITKSPAAGRTGSARWAMSAACRRSPKAACTSTISAARRAAAAPMRALRWARGCLCRRRRPLA